MYYIFIVNALAPPLLTIFNPLRILKYFKRRILMNQKAESTLTQSEAHKLFEEDIQNFPSQYAVIIKTMLLTSFYFTAMPIVCVFTVIGLCLFYWANKVFNSFFYPINSPTDNIIEIQWSPAINWR